MGNEGAQTSQPGQDRECEGRGWVNIWGFAGLHSLLAGSWVVINRVTILITHIRGLITPLITTPEPPSRSCVILHHLCRRLSDVGFWLAACSIWSSGYGGMVFRAVRVKGLGFGV